MTFHATATHSLVPVADIGVIIRSARNARRPRVTQAKLGALIGYSESWVSRVEKGQITPPWATLLKIAALLHITVEDLAQALHPHEPEEVPGAESDGRASGPAARVAIHQVTEDQEDVVLRRKLLRAAVGVSTVVITGTAAAANGRQPAFTDPSAALETALFQPPHADPLPLDRLVLALRAAREDFRQARYAALSEDLPKLLATATATCDNLTGHHRENAQAALARAYAMAGELAIKTRSGTAWVAADRALTAARASGQAAPLGEAARVLAVTMRQAGRSHAALDVLAGACATLAEDARPAAQDVRAASLLTAAYTAAHTGDRSRALNLAGEAEEIGRRLAQGPDTDSFTIHATRAQCDAFHISIHNVLGTPDEGITYARRINPSVFTTPERRARYWTDTARMWARLGDHERTFAALRAVEQQAPEEARRPSVRALTADLLYSPVNLPGLTEYAARTRAAHN
ncbi:helix-turn-helix domain-containing protein [Streptomyces syringium]|uniref:helix-turn-helix domain-containing protein n=1 Tax=Streptomyces syringium TaxID=76729 RepID=UPI0033D1AC22